MCTLKKYAYNIIIVHMYVPAEASFLHQNNKQITLKPLSVQTYNFSTYILQTGFMRLSYIIMCKRHMELYNACFIMFI